MAKKRVGRYPKEFRRMAVERLKSCDNIVALAQELGVHRRLLYKWRDQLEPMEESEGSLLHNSRVATLRKEVSQLKRVLADKVVEVDFFRGALHKSRGSTPEARKLWREGIYDLGAAHNADQKAHRCAAFRDREQVHRRSLRQIYAPPGERSLLRVADSRRAKAHHKSSATVDLRSIVDRHGDTANTRFNKVAPGVTVRMRFTPVKRLILFVFAACFALSTLAVPQDTMKSPDTTKASKAVSVMGTISADGKSFVSDKDKTTWTITNSDSVKGHEGHHVVLKAHVNPNTKEVEVVSLKMAKTTSKDEMQKY